MQVVRLLFELAAELGFHLVRKSLTLISLIKQENIHFKRNLWRLKPPCSGGMHRHFVKNDVRNIDVLLYQFCTKY